ncbi:uncharacterized protein LOC6580134 isoform X1 [Drosophila mojavensis]|uniref:Uncharacterized protein, isoform B n=1 Tax=Drosophila mojavensis TaxID=7230 RepID=A0A0Q9X9C9_DROMO|nr:uncharacterized protein LOC6580134 isoform X1 [Drosophila mojavensis]XP_015019594.1 uncharacterized protein LOC6580134 isoform X1 [Drosophila mojavensis]XP_015019595.1 uncharacterized protein LOC6580134 isoform X1 [Drosophila mojavensis]XP_015019598.1 uncharacterized protein LOC6580134 isoform X1 [Drosophila mojavensis]KRG04988.1 uncharacterized protein Dmoj_GI18788, isoform B [Drosophila mojavensis]KRG04990.1 uncharacterized protein Dmoj_GI18788, isoform E [Drosophila mojavensis]KRG04991.
MTDVEQPPQNGIDPTAGEDDENSKARPADIEQDMREMERRKRVEAIMGSKLFREELERIVDSAREGSAGASGILQQLSDIVGVPVNRVSNVFKSGSCMVPINDIRGVESMGYAKGEKILRCKLAATFRLLDLYGWTQGLGAQITARLKVDQEYFLVNPYGLLYHEITASALNKVDMQGQIVEQGTTNFGVNKSHFVLHSVVHAARPDIRCAIYIGCSPVVAISSLKTGLLALTKDACVLGEISTHAYTGLFDAEERDRLVRSLGPNSKVMLLTNHGALCCGETIEEAFFAACHIVQACETQLKLLPVGLDNLVLIPEESRKLIYDQSRRPPEDLEKKFAAITTDEDGAAGAGKEEAAAPKIGSPPKWRVGGAEFEALMRMLDNAGYRTGYIYRHPLIKSDPPKPKNDVELPPAVSSLGYLLEEEELFRQGIWKKGDLRKGGDRSRWLNSPNVYQKVEVLETGTPDPKKITKWVAEGSPTHSTPVRIEDPLQFVPAGTTTKEFKRVQQQIKDNRRADKISAGPQSHILEGVTWDEANRIKDATVSQTGDHVVLMGAASKGIIQRGFQHNATVYKAPYAKNPFDNVTDDELNEYKRTVERKKKSIHGEYTDTDFSESEALNSMQAAGAHAHAKHAQSEPETEHQVIQIQTQQAPIPSQAEVVLSDDLQDQDTVPDTVDVQGNKNNDDVVYDELDKENHIQNATKCRRDLLSAFTNPNDAAIPSSSPYIQEQNDVDLPVNPESQAAPIAMLQGDLYSYAYGAASLGRCCQPQICSVLLHALHSEHLQNVGYYRNNRSSTTSSTGTTNESSPTPRRPLQLANGIPPPYRTLSHFGFNSPRQAPRTEHKHLPAKVDFIRYRPIQRVISYEEIFATPRYEQLCHFCFEQLLRLKPGLQRRSAASSSGEEPDDGLSCPGSFPVSPRQLTTLTELDDEEDYEDRLYIRQPMARMPCHVSTQTSSILLSSQFLKQLENLNFSEESTNVNYVPGLQTINSDLTTPTSPAASASSAPPLHSAKKPDIDPNDKTRTDLTEVWNFGNWQEQAADVNAQQPLTERRITLEITQQFAHNPEEQQQAERQLMSRDDRQRRKLEFQELWQDHVQYFGAKQEMEQESPETPEHTLTISLDAQEDKTLRAYGWLREQQSYDEEGNSNNGAGSLNEPVTDYQSEATGEGHYEEPLSSNTHDIPSVTGDSRQQAVAEIPKILEEFEQSLCVAGQNLEKLVATTKKLREVTIAEEPLSDDSIESGSLFRAISLENIPNADDTVSVSEPQRFEPQDLSTDEESQEVGDESHGDIDQEEKRDIEKPVTPVPLVFRLKPKGKHHIECKLSDEKDVDENENDMGDIVESASTTEISLSAEPTASSDELATPQRESSSDMFSPLERDILDSIEADNLKERESIFGRIDESIRNKLTPCKLQLMVSGTEETFETCTHIYKSPTNATPPTRHLFQFTSEPRPSTFSQHDISAPASSSAHARVIPGKTPRLSRSWDRRLDSSESSSSTSLRSSPRKRRNFVQENIRNASKPRGYTKSKPLMASRLKSVQVKSSDLSAVCTFEAEKRGSSSRLWVSLPTSPRSTAGHKRRYASPNDVRHPVIHSPHTKRAKPIENQTTKLNRNLYKTISSTTFCTESLECDESLAQNISSTTFEVGYMSEDQQSGTPPNPINNNNEAIASPENKNNATGSSMYYSADDNTVVDMLLEMLENESLEQDMEEHMYDNGNQASVVSSNDTQEESQAEAREINEATDEVYTGNKNGLSETSNEIELGTETMESKANEDKEFSQNLDIEQFLENTNADAMESDLNDPDNCLDEFIDIGDTIIKSFADELRAQNQIESAIEIEESAMKSEVENKLGEIVSEGIENQLQSINNIEGEVLNCVTDQIFQQLISQGIKEFDNIERAMLQSSTDEVLRELLSHGLSNQSDNKPDMPSIDDHNAALDNEEYKIDTELCLFNETANGNTLTYIQSSFSLTSNRANFNICAQETMVSSSINEGVDSSDEKSSINESLPQNHHELPLENQDTIEEDNDNKPSTSARAAARNMKRTASGALKATEKAAKTEKGEGDDTVVLSTKCTLKDGTLQVKADDSFDDIQAPRCENNKTKLCKPCDAADDDLGWDLFEVDDILQFHDDELLEEELEEEIDYSDDDSPHFFTEEEDEDVEEDDDDEDGNVNMEDNNNVNVTVDVNLNMNALNPNSFDLLGAMPDNNSPPFIGPLREIELDEFGQMDMDLDTQTLHGYNPNLPSRNPPAINWPADLIYDYGPFIVEFRERPGEPDANANENSPSPQTLEVSQNEMNQATAQELNLQLTDDIPMCEDKPKNEPKGEPKNEPNDENEPKDEPKNEPEDENENEPKDEEKPPGNE